MLTNPRAFHLLGPTAPARVGLAKIVAALFPCGEIINNVAGRHCTGHVVKSFVDVGVRLQVDGPVDMAVRHVAALPQPVLPAYTERD